MKLKLKKQNISMILEVILILFIEFNVYLIIISFFLILPIRTYIYRFLNWVNFFFRQVIDKYTTVYFFWFP